MFRGYTRLVKITTNYCTKITQLSSLYFLDNDNFGYFGMKLCASRSKSTNILIQLHFEIFPVFFGGNMDVKNFMCSPLIHMILAKNNQKSIVTCNSKKAKIIPSFYFPQNNIPMQMQWIKNISLNLINSTSVCLFVILLIELKIHRTFQNRFISFEQ